MSIREAQPVPPGKVDFLSFQLGGLDYGLEFGKVKELRTLRSLERFAADGTIISGVAVSRGVIMPIVDMRVAFDAGVAAPGPLTDVIILQLANCVVGMVVDGVTDVVSLYADQITPIPGADGECGSDYLLGLGEAGGRRLILIDIDCLMSIRRQPASSAQRVA
ncbi:MAG: chemotaxis protein CheW [Massilia sp.]